MIEVTQRTGGWFVSAFLYALFLSCTAPLVGVVIQRADSIASKRPKDPSCPDCKLANRPLLQAQPGSGALAVAE